MRNKHFLNIVNKIGKYKDSNDAKIHRAGLIFIYKQDYILLKSQSTIETITLD